MKRRISALLAALLCWFVQADSALGVSTFVVTNTDDAGTGSLRQAILDANATPNSGGPDLVSFAIPGAGPHAIIPASALPTITEPVIVNGFTQSGSSPNTNVTGGLNTVLRIVLDGVNAGASHGLVITSGSSTIRGLVIHRFSQLGIHLQTNGANTIEGNFIGTNQAGDTRLPNGGSGIFIQSPSNVIGGTTAAARNLISGNNFHGVEIVGAPASGNQIRGNLIGTNAAGTGPLSPGSPAGVFVRASAGTTTVGGPNASDRNIISGNGFSGVWLEDSSGNTVQGNFIGTDVTGMVAVPNGRGFTIGSGNTSNNVVGGSAAGAGNLISGNAGEGLRLFGPTTTGNTIRGNLVGTKINGTEALGNGLSGIDFRSSPASGNTIGGTSAGDGNIFAHNGGFGILMQNGNANAILGNSFHGNALMGLDLGGDGVTANDAGDLDAGSNNGQNFPVLTSADHNNGNTTILGSLQSTANTAFRIEFFSSPACDSSGNGEGQTFLGSTSVTTVGNDATINTVLPVAVTPGHVVTATATDPANNTSEFSGCVVATGTVPPPSPTPTPTPTPTPSATPAATPARLLNIATRMRVQTGENVLIGGFIITGTDPKQVIIRGIGPSLSAFFSGTLSNPALELFQGDTVLQSNDDWKTDQRTEIEATGIPPANDLEAAIVRTLAPGAYTAILRGNGDSTGIGVVEAYDLNAGANSQLANIATRGFVETGDNVMIGGLIVGPADAQNANLVVRAIGPSLGNFGITGALQNPTLELVTASGTVLRSNNDWKDSQRTEIEAVSLQPGDDRESALVETVAPGAYTAIVRGVSNTTGVALVEVYNLP